MDKQIFFSSPLEQFQIIPIINLYIGLLGFDFTITNEILMIALGNFIVFSFFFYLLKKDGTFAMIPGKIQGFFEGIYKFVASLLNNIKISVKIQKDRAYFFPLLFSVFTYVLTLNLHGLIPCSYTPTSQLIVTVALALGIFIGLIILGCLLKGPQFVKLFLPGGTSFVLSFLLVPVEILSFLFKPISLAVRLFANMMAGHTLLKVIATFLYRFTLMGVYAFLFMYIPVCILVPLFGMEFGVACIQTVVFVTLITIYINDKFGDDH